MTDKTINEALEYVKKRRNEGRYLESADDPVGGLANSGPRERAEMKKDKQIDEGLVPDGYALVPIELWWNLQAGNWQKVDRGVPCCRLDLTYPEPAWKNLMDRLAAAPQPDNGD